MTSEAAIKAAILTGIDQSACRLFNNPVGEALQGKVRESRSGLLVTGARRIRFGLAPGSSDLIGLRSVVVTPEMLGQRVALFTAIEVKGPTGTFRDGQEEFLDLVRAFGGLAGVARSVEDARQILREGRR